MKGGDPTRHWVSDFVIHSAKRHIVAIRERLAGGRCRTT